MKKSMILVMALMTVMATGCTSSNTTDSDTATEIETASETATATEIVTVSEVDSEMEDYNRELLSKVVTDDTVNIVDNTLQALTKFDAGKLQEVSFTSDETGYTIGVVSEEGTNYKILLSTNGSLLGIQDVDNDNWIYTVTE